MLTFITFYIEKYNVIKSGKVVKKNYKNDSSDDTPQ